MSDRQSSASPSPRRIGIFTSGRQDWWILHPVARAIAQRDDLDLTVFISGTHLLDAFGRTERAVRAGGFRCVEAPLYPAGADQSIAAGPLADLAGNLTRAMRENPVDVMVVLGDRMETLLASVLAVADQRFLAHIHGGDRAPGEFDDSCRHAITKLAHIHFPATRASAERILRLGESAERVHMVGSPSIDGVLADGVAEPAQARSAVGLAGDKPYALVLYHPAGLGDAAEAQAAGAICQAVAEAGLSAVLVGPNSDPGWGAVWNLLRDFSSRWNWPIVPTVDRPVFLRLMHDAVALVGNSSAGMVESAAVGAAVVNVGPRQEGREHSANVVDVPAEPAAIAGVLRRLQTQEGFATSLRAAECIFGDGRASQRIAQALAAMPLSAGRRIKLNEY